MQCQLVIELEGVGVVALPKFYKSATRLSARLAQIDLTSQSTRMKAVLNTLMNKIKVANTGGVLNMLKMDLS